MNHRRKRLRRILQIAAAPLGLLFGATIPALAALAQVEMKRIVGSGNVVTENRAVSGFQKVSVSGVGILTITRGDRETLSIEAEDNVLPVIHTEVKDGTLHIRIREKVSLERTRPIRYTLTVKTLETLKMSGATEAEVGPISADRFAVEVSGATKARFANLSAKELKVGMSGASAIHLAGNGEKQTVQMSGAGKYDASGFATREANVSASGAGKSVLRVNDRLTVRASGAVTVAYHGKPAVDKQTSGVCKVHEVE